MSSMRDFLQRVLPWPPAGDAEAFVNIHYNFQKPDMDKPRLAGRSGRTIDEVVKIVDDALRSQSNTDIYFCTSTQRMSEEKLDRLGRPFRKAIRSIVNAVEFKAFFADVDVKDSGYPDQKACLVALANLCKETGLPRPTALVSSGTGGLHVYWTLKEPVAAATWRPLARALSLLFINHNFKTDAACTIDAARILRVPETFNHKDGAQRPVKLVLLSPNDIDLADIEKAVKSYVTNEQEGILPQRKAVTDDEMSAGVEMRPRIVLDDVAKKCPLIADALATGGKDHEEPVWDQLVLISTFTEGGREDAHRMSSGHPKYTREETDEKFDRRENDQIANDLGWPKCETLMMRGSQFCKSCPHLQFNRSPLNLFTPAPPLPGVTVPSPSTPASVGGGTNDLPAGYVRDVHDLIYRVVPQPDGTHEQVLISPYQITKGWLQDNPWTLNFTTRPDSRRAVQIKVPFEDTSSKLLLAKCLSVQGMAVSEIHIKLIGEFFVSWIQELRRRKDSVVSSTPFGWHTDNGKIVGFAYGGSVFSASGTTMAASPEPQLAHIYTPKGDLQVWKDAVKIITDQKSAQFDAIIASSFAAPLVRHSGYSGFLLSVYSSASGIGKSTTMKLAQAVWGDPNRMQSLDDTQNSIARKAGQLKALPLLWDELKTEADTLKFVKIAFQITQGKEKDRLRANSSLMETGTWETMLTVASNDSLIDYVTRGTRSTVAGVMRVFEYEALPNPNFKLDGGVVSRMVAKCSDHYGQAGLVYAEFLGKNPDLIAKQVAELDEKLRKQYNCQNEERYWFSMLTCLLLGATYANHLGLTNIDIANLKKFLFDQLELMREARKETSVDMKDQHNVVAVLTQFLNAMAARHTLVTNWMQMGPGRPPAEGYKILNDITRLDTLYVQMSKDQGAVRFSQAHFLDWLRDHGYSTRIVTKALEDQLQARRARVRLGSGTPRSWFGDDWCIEVRSSSLVGPITKNLEEKEVTPEVTE